MFKKYQLTEMYFLELCLKSDKGALNGEDFIAQKDWVIEQDMGENFGRRYSYYTIASKSFKLPSKAENPKDAVQQILAYAYTGKETKFKNMWFKITEQESKW